jgi:hypothetical protein
MHPMSCRCGRRLAVGIEEAEVVRHTAATDARDAESNLELLWKEELAMKLAAILRRDRKIGTIDRRNSHPLNHPGINRSVEQLVIDRVVQVAIHVIVGPPCSDAVNDREVGPNRRIARRLASRLRAHGLFTPIQYGRWNPGGLSDFYPPGRVTLPATDRLHSGVRAASPLSVANREHATVTAVAVEAHLPHYGATVGEVEEERLVEEQAARRWLAAALAYADEHGVTLATEIRAGHPAQELVRACGCP